MVSRSPSKADKPKQLPHNLSSSDLPNVRLYGFKKHGHASNDPKHKWQNRVDSQGKTLSKNNIQEKSGGSFSDVFKRQKKQTHQGYRFQKDPNKKPNYRPTTRKKERTGFFSTRIFWEKFFNFVERVASFGEHIPTPEEHKTTKPRKADLTEGGKSRGRMANNQSGYGR